MSITAPIYLLLLVPLAGFTIYLLIGRRNVVTVPFVELWQGMRGAPRARRWVRRPPSAVILVLLTLLLAILAATRPAIHPILQRYRAVVMIDNGVTMMPAGRLESAMKRAGEELSSRFGFCDISLVCAVGDEVGRTDSSDISGLASTITTYPVDTEHALRAKIGRQVQQQDAPVIVLSDRTLSIVNDRVFQVAPTTPVSNVGIVDVAVRDWPLGQMMLRVRNDSPFVESGVEIRTGQLNIERKIALPPPGEAKDYFFDLSEVGPEVKVTLGVTDDLTFDNTASLIRTSANPRVEIRGEVGPAVRRMIEVFSKNRPSEVSSDKVIVCDSLFQLPAMRAVAVASTNSAMKPIRGPIQVEMSHPILREIDFRSLDRSTVAGTSPGDGWTSIARSNDQVLLAVRDRPARQAWVGFNSSNFESTRDFVILWSNILEYLGEGAAKIGYEPVGPLSPGALPPMVPGIYQKPNGSHVAMNVVDVKFGVNAQAISHLPTTLPASAGEGFELSPMLTLAAAICVLISALLLLPSA